MDKELVLVMEEDETGAKVGKFYENKVEVTWDDVVDSKSVVENKNKSEDVEEGDVVVESIVELNAIVEQSSETSAKETEKERIVSIDIDTDTAKKETPKIIAKESAPKLFKVVPPTPLEVNVEHKVYFGHLESTSKAWICRLEDEGRVSDIMERLASLAGRYYLFFNSINA